MYPALSAGLNFGMLYRDSRRAQRKAGLERSDTGSPKFDIACGQLAGKAEIVNRPLHLTLERCRTIQSRHLRWRCICRALPRGSTAQRGGKQIEFMQVTGGGLDVETGSLTRRSAETNIALGCSQVRLVEGYHVLDGVIGQVNHSVHGNRLGVSVGDRRRHCSSGGNRSVRAKPQTLHAPVPRGLGIGVHAAADGLAFEMHGWHRAFYGIQRDAVN